MYMDRTGFILDESAVNVQIGHILNLAILMILTGAIVTAFYHYTDSSSQQSMRAGFADLGSEVARDITNIYITSEGSQNNISFHAKRDIPLTVGGRGYKIELREAAADSGEPASIDITDGSFFGYTGSTVLNSIDANVNASGVVYSGSGEINIGLIKNSTGVWIWIE